MTLLKMVLATPKTLVAQFEKVVNFLKALAIQVKLALTNLGTHQLYITV